MKYYKYILISKSKLLVFVLLLFCNLSLNARVIQMWEDGDSLRIVNAEKLEKILLNASEDDIVDLESCIVVGKFKNRGTANKISMNKRITGEVIHGSKSDTIYCSINAKSCIFENKVYFQFMTFKGKVNFEEATFKNDTFFYKANFIGGTIFWGATFNSYVNFKKALFDNEIYFWNVTFKDYTNFSESIFNNYTCFIDANFCGNTCFDYTVFTDYTDFRGTIFRRFTSFNSATFKNPTLFTSSRFEETIEFNQIILENGAHLYFTNAYSKKNASFMKINIKDSSKIYFQNFYFTPGKFKIDWKSLQANKIYHIGFLHIINKPYPINIYPINRDWNSLNDKHRLYSILMDNFKAQGDWPSYDGCYYEWKTIELKEFFYDKNLWQFFKSLPYYIFNFINYHSCDAGTNPFKLIIVSFLVVLYFSFIYWLRDIPIKKLKNWLKCIIFSSVTVLIIVAFKNNFLGMLLFIVVLSIYVIIGNVSKVGVK